MRQVLLVSVIATLAAPGFAGVAPCVRKSGGAVQEPPTLSALVECQSTALDAYQSADPNLSDRDVDAIQEKQEAETREYLQRHPERANMDASAADKPSSEAAAPADVAVSSTASAASGASSGLTDLKSKLEAESDSGKNGITPQMAQDIAAFLNKSQGGMSSDMSALLDSLQKDGPNLSDASMLRLKGALRQAKGQGLDLGIDPKMEQWLLDPATDPKAALPAVPTN